MLDFNGLMFILDMLCFTRISSSFYISVYLFTQASAISFVGSLEPDKILHRGIMWETQGYGENL